MVERASTVVRLNTNTASGNVPEKEIGLIGRVNLVASDFVP